MFKVTESPTFRWPVSFRWANDGVYDTHTFTGIFKRLKAIDLAAKIKVIHENGYAMDHRVDFLRGVIVGFSNVEHNGTDAELMEFMLGDPSIVNALYETYCKAVAGVADESIEIKNSETPPSA